MLIALRLFPYLLTFTYYGIKACSVTVRAGCNKNPTMFLDENPFPSNILTIKIQYIDWMCHDWACTKLNWPWLVFMHLNFDQKTYGPLFECSDVQSIGFKYHTASVSRHLTCTSFTEEFSLKLNRLFNRWCFIRIPKATWNCGIKVVFLRCSAADYTRFE